MTYRLRNIVLAVALAALAALLTSFYVANYKKTVRADEANVTVYVAAKKIPVGTTGADAASRGFFETSEVTRRSVVPGAISSPSEIRDLVATETVYEGEQISVRRFRPVQAAGVRAELKGNLRAMQVAGDSNQLLAGTLKRGDRVDVVASFKVTFEGEGEHPVTRVILRDLLVLAAPGGATFEASSKIGGEVGDAAVQLAVTDSQAQKLEFARQHGTWTLALRPVTDPADSPETVETTDTVVCDGLNRNRYAFFCSGRNG